MKRVWFSLGSNIGDRAASLRTAIEALTELVSRPACAPLYETSPRDFEDQPDFLNTVLRGKTACSPPDLLAAVQRIESTGGRERLAAQKKGPRSIDIDILLYADVCRTWTGVGEGSLTIPHKAMHERLFVLKPLLDLNPQLEDPRDGVPWAVKASRLGAQRVKLYRNAR